MRTLKGFAASVDPPDPHFSQGDIVYKLISKRFFAKLAVFILLVQPLFAIGSQELTPTPELRQLGQAGKYAKPINRGSPSAVVAPFWDRLREQVLGELKPFFHERLGTPKSIYGQMINVSHQMANPEAAAREFLSEHAGLFQLRSPAELRLIKMVDSPGATHIYFEHVYRGIRVQGGQMSVHINRQGIITTVTNSYIPGLELETVHPNVNSETVYQYMVGELAGRTGRVVFDRAASRELVVYPAGSAVYLAWRLLLPLKEPLGTWEAFWDARTGQRISDIVDKNYYSDGSGKVFIPNPVVALNDTGIRDMNDSNSAVPDSAYTTVTLFDLDGSGFLNGPHVNTGPTPSRVSRPTNNFTDIRRGDNGFEEVETYWALDTSKRYFDSLGFTSVMNYSIGVNAEGSNQCNAFYSGFGNGQGAITLHSPSGQPDAGEDADVTWHEYGHAVMDHQVPNIAQNFDGMGEGFGDYLAAAMSNREGPAGTHSTYDPCLGEWFSQCFTSAEPACLRRMDHSTAVAHWPEHRSGDPHFTGEIWAAALYDLQNMIGRDTTGSLALEGNFRLPGAPSMPEGAEAVNQADQDLFAGSHATTINTVFTSRGLFPQPYRITSPTHGDVWQIGMVKTVAWQTSRPTSESVVIMLSRTGGGAGEFTKIATTQNDGSFDWTVTGPETTEAVIRIRHQSLGDTYRDHSTGFFTISSSPPPNTLTVNVPNGGESWQEGSDQNVQWSSTGVIANVKIELSRTGLGGPYQVLFVSTPNDGSQSWTVTGPTTSNAFMRITDVVDPGTSDTSNSAFAITSAPSNSVTVTSPNGGEAWQEGTNQNIAWTTTGSIANVKIELSRTGAGGSYEVLFASTPNDGSQSWTVTGPTTSNAFVRITDAASPATSDTSNSAFSITAAPTGQIMVIVPNGGEVWPFGSQQTIQWNPGGLGGDVKIRISTDGGATFRAITNSTPNAGSFVWTVNRGPTTQAKIQVVWLSDPNVRDESDNVFTISP